SPRCERLRGQAGAVQPVRSGGAGAGRILARHQRRPPGQREEGSITRAARAGRVRVLHIEDDDMDAELIEATLGAGVDCEVRRVVTRAEYLAALEEGGFDVILADYALPSFSGPAALTAARTRRPELPFVFLSGTLGDERAVDTLKAGATDYVLKDHLSRLVPVVRRALDEAAERAARREAENALASSQRFLQRM